jgi:serine/threonine-protein kinase
MVPPLPTPASPTRYQIEATLGEGGMGTVYRARDGALGRTVALKVIRADSLTPAALERFDVEARAVAALDHPHVVKIHDVLQWPSLDGGTSPALALEFVRGGSLSRKLGKGPLSPALAARLVAMLARAVAHAHERGIVHRDLKPDNVLMADVTGGPDAGHAAGLSQGERLRAGAAIGRAAHDAAGGDHGDAGVFGPRTGRGAARRRAAGRRLLAGRYPLSLADGQGAVRVGVDH